MYMSPEQLSQDNGNQGYLGSAVDVWASGVLLIVMLVRWKVELAGFHGHKFFVAKLEVVDLWRCTRRC